MNVAFADPIQSYEYLFICFLLCNDSDNFAVAAECLKRQAANGSFFMMKMNTIKFSFIRFGSG